jgi:hypothetical protein
MKENKLAQMPAGKYWIGDLCYVMHDNWDEFCQKAYDSETGKDNNGLMVLNNGTKVAWFNTKWGDGLYRDTRGNRYPVDAGLIGCIKMNDIDFDHPHNDLLGGNIVSFKEDFECGYENGLIWFGHGRDSVEIQTDDMYGEDEEEEDEDYEQSYN